MCLCAILLRCFVQLQCVCVFACQYISNNHHLYVICVVLLPASISLSLWVSVCTQTDQKLMSFDGNVCYGEP